MIPGFQNIHFINMSGKESFSLKFYILFIDNKKEL